MQFRVFKRDFKFTFFYTSLYLLVFALLLSLGFWQLERSDEKRKLIEQKAQQAEIILELNGQTIADIKQIRYQKVTVEGAYDTKHQFLIDNQIVKAKAGYFVLTPFILKDSQKAILVNRGWVVANPNRSILPEISLSEEKLQQLKGRINTFPSVGIKLKGAEIPTDGFPSVVQVVDSEVLAKKLSYPLFPFQIELAPQHSDGYIRQWSENKLMSPEKHTAYAVQWFGLAITLTLLFFWYSSKKQRDD